MNRCIQITIGSQVFKFDNVDLSNDKGSGDVTYNIRNIISRIERNPRHLEQLGTLLNTITSDSARKTITPNITDVTEYADNVLGDVTPLALSTILRDTGQSPAEFDAITALIGRNQEGLIKIDNTLDRPKIYLGSKRSLIVAPTKSLSSQTMMHYLSYIYLDSKIKDTASNVFKTVNSLFYDFKERTLITKGKVSTTVLEELDQLDSVNRNKRLLSYIFKDILANENRDLFDLYILKLGSIVNDAIKTKMDANVGRLDAAAYNLIESNNSSEIVSISQNVNKTLSEVVDLLKEYRTLRQDKSAEDIIPELPTTLDDILDNVYHVSNNILQRDEATKTYKELSPKAKLMTIVTTKLVTTNPEGAYDISSFRKYNPAQLEYIYNHADIFKDVFNLSEASPEVVVNIGNLLLDKVISHRPVMEGDIPLPNVDVEFGENLKVNPSRMLKFDSFGNNPAGLSYVLTIDINPKIHSEYKLNKNTLSINPKLFNRNTVIELPDISKSINSVYIPYLGNDNTQLLSEVLMALKNAGYVREFKTDGMESQSVRLAIEANNLGMSVTVHPKNAEFRSKENGEIDMQRFKERFDFIMPVLPGSLKPTLKFYSANSSNGYEFTNTKGNVNLNNLLSAMEASMPEGEYLDYFDLTSNGTITALLVSQKTKENGMLINSITGSEIDLYDKNSDRHHKFVVDNKYKLDGDYLPVGDASDPVGVVYTDGVSLVVPLALIDGRIRVARMSKGKVIISTILENELTNYSTILGRLSNKSGILNYKNKVFISVDGTYKAPTITELQNYYKDEISELSNKSGFSETFIKNKKLNSLNSFETINVIELTPVNDTRTTESVSSAPVNFNGKLFIERLANKLNTPVHFLTTNQLNGLSENFGNAKGLVYNGEIYINSDKFEEDRGVILHELSHIILAYFKETNYEAYLKLLNSLSMEGTEFDKLRELYPELTNQDLREEYLAERFSKSFNRLFTDDNLDEQLSSLEFTEALNRLLELSTDIDSDVRSILEMQLQEVASNSESNMKAFGEIFPRVTHEWGAISNLKSKLLKSTDEKNKLTETNCR